LQGQELLGERTKTKERRSKVKEMRRLDCGAFLVFFLQSKRRINRNSSEKRLQKDWGNSGTPDVSLPRETKRGGEF